MKLTSLLLLASAAAALGATEEQINKHFKAQPGGKLVVEVDFGAIDIRTNANSEVAVDVWRKIGRKTKAEEEAFLKENPVEFIEDGATLTIRSRHKGANAWSFGGKVQNEAKYTLTVPSQFDARVLTGGGGVDIRDLTGEVNARTGGGGMNLERLQGPLDANTGGGGINATDCEGRITLRCGGGGLEIVNGSGSIDGDTGGGSITVKRFKGATHIRTGGGGLDIERVEGDLEGSTGGGGISAVMPSELAGSVKLSTGGGGIHVKAPEGSAFDLDAQTGGGSVSSDLPVAITGKPDRSRLKGPINGGGKPVVLRSGGGGIHIGKS